MDPATTFCPNPTCLARGQPGHGNIGIRSCKEQRLLCKPCRTTFATTKGTAFYRLRTPAETVSLVLTLLAHGYLSARLTMKNLFDKSYRSPGSGIDAPGTNAIVTLEAHF